MLCVSLSKVSGDALQRTPVVHSLTISASATVALVLLFLPKVYIMIFKPEKNDRSAFTTTRDVRCHIGRAAGFTHQHSFSTSAESFDRSVICAATRGFSAATELLVQVGLLKLQLCFQRPQIISAFIVNGSRHLTRLTQAHIKMQINTSLRYVLSQIWCLFTCVPLRIVERVGVG